ncbi:hypothetical protein ACM64Y_15700 [Novispirillum sp. DQ9]|uniref:hypothetical protein n=1 Tax=Novispirillum sp. DQ9 TaxID=3398612 RepID=UPI003C7BF68C
MHWVDLYYGARDRLTLGLAILVLVVVAIEAVAVPRLLWLAEASYLERKALMTQVALASTLATLVGMTVFGRRSKIAHLAMTVGCAIGGRALNIIMEPSLGVPQGAAGLMTWAQFLVLVVALFLGVGPVVFFAASYAGMLLLHFVFFGMPGPFVAVLIAALPVALVTKEVRSPTDMEEHDSPLGGAIMLALSVVLALMTASFVQLACLIAWIVATDS